MTSEVNNILNGQVVVKVNDLKQIAVASSTIKPDESGIAPLEKQDAFIVQAENDMSNMQQAAPTLESPTQETPEMVNPTVSEMAVGVNQPIETEVEPPSLDAETLEKNAQASIEEGVVDSIDYQKPNDNGILTAPPVDVADASKQDQINISSLPDKIVEGIDNLLKEEPVQENAIQPMDMPVMDQEIPAQEPTAQDNRLFVGTAEQQNQQTPEVVDTPFTVPAVDTTVPNDINTVQEPVASEMPAQEPTVELEPIAEPVIEPIAPTIETQDEPKVEENNNESVFDNYTEMSDTPQTDIPLTENTVGEMPSFDNFAGNQNMEPIFPEQNELNEVLPFQTIGEEAVNNAQKPTLHDDETLVQNIIQKINELSEMLNEYKNQIDELVELTKEYKSKAVEQEPVLNEQPILGELTSSQPTVEEPVNEINSINSFDSVDNTPIIPTIDNSDKSFSEIPSIDEEQIRGGKLV